MRYLKDDDVVKVNLTKSPIKLDKYDMYYIRFQMTNGKVKTVRAFCEKGTFPDFQSNDFEQIKQIYGENLISDFFIKRLLGENGLMNKEGRDDYIYLGGNLLKNNYLANRYMIQQNGKTGQQNFDDNLFSLKLQIQAKENIPKNNKQISNSKDSKGKTYVIGDIHGMYGSYVDVMKKMNKNDHLVILGDVIDRGTGGIQILQDIMKRKQDSKNNPKITFLLGNHEMQFLENIDIMMKHGLNKEDITNIINWRNTRSRMGYYRLHNDEQSKQAYQYWKNEFNKYNVKYQTLINEKRLSEWELDAMGIWLTSNKGNTTIFDFLKGGRVNGTQEQKAIYKFLRDSYVALPQNVNGKDYLFVHAMPPRDSQMLRKMKQTGKGYKFTETTRDEYEFMLQERDFSTYEQAKRFDFTTICGHTPSAGTILKDKNKGFIRIDAGCGHGKKNNNKLALYCVDNGTVEYFDEKENTYEQTH
ncbi:MAG: hypothetical protein HFJ45_05700 [Clostridia bacterium]|nr:hypothetical protein [Clostridia bacterium]